MIFKRLFPTSPLLRPNVVAVTFTTKGCVQDYIVLPSEATTTDKWEATEWPDIRALPHITMMDPTSASLTTCATIATKMNHMYFGVEGGVSCW